MNIGSALLMGVLGAVVGAVGCWWLIGSYYHPEPTGREQALWKRIGELQSIMEVPPFFWQVWARYTHELSQSDSDAQAHGKHAADDDTDECGAADNLPYPPNERG